MAKVLPHECVLCKDHSCSDYTYIKGRKELRDYPLHHCGKVDKHFRFVVPDWCPRDNEE